MKILKVAYQYWMKFAKALGKVQSAIILFFIYFIGIGIMSLISFLFRRDFLDKHFIDKNSFWRDRPPEVPNVEDSKRQF